MKARTKLADAVAWAGRLFSRRDDRVRRWLYPNLGRETFALFKRISEAAGLSVLTRTCVPEQVWDRDAGHVRLVIRPSLDEIRAAAIATGDLTAIHPPEWCGEDGVWVDVWDDRNGPPVHARIRVDRRGFARSITGMASWHTYAPYTQSPAGPVLDPWWAMLGSYRLADVAELNALSRAFPTPGLALGDPANRFLTY